jgi:hypothetical protein
MVGGLRPIEPGRTAWRPLVACAVGRGVYPGAEPRGPRDSRLRLAVQLLLRMGRGAGTGLEFDFGGERSGPLGKRGFGRSLSAVTVGSARG